MNSLSRFFLSLLILCVCSAPSFAVIAAEDSASMSPIVSMYQNDDITLDQALSSALQQEISFEAIIAAFSAIGQEVTTDNILAAAVRENVSFVVIVDACRSNNVPLADIVAADVSTGTSETAAIANVIGAGITDVERTALLAEYPTGLGYGNDNTLAGAVNVVNANPAGTRPGGSVSPSNP